MAVEGAGEGQETRVVGIVSGKGGVGKTTLSANLAIALTALGKKVVVVDCNVTTPHLSYYLGAENYSTTLNDVFAGDVDVKFAPLDKDGVMFIPASEKFVDLKKVDMKDLKGIIENLKKDGDFDFIILDSAPGLGREAIGVLQACNEIVFLTQPTVPNVADIVRCNEVAQLLGHKKFSMVFNMVRGRDYELSPDKAEELFEIPVLGVIPFDENIMDSTAEGVPILWYRPKAPSCNIFLGIAAGLAGIDLHEFAKSQREKEYGEGETMGIGIGPFGASESEDVEEEEYEEPEKEQKERRILPIVKRPVGKQRQQTRKTARTREFKNRVGKATSGVAKKIKRIFRR